MLDPWISQTWASRSPGEPSGAVAEWMNEWTLTVGPIKWEVCVCTHTWMICVYEYVCMQVHECVWCVYVCIADCVSTCDSRVYLVCIYICTVYQHMCSYMCVSVWCVYVNVYECVWCAHVCDVVHANSMVKPPSPCAPQSDSSHPAHWSQIIKLPLPNLSSTPGKGKFGHFLKRLCQLKKKKYRGGRAAWKCHLQTQYKKKETKTKTNPDHQTLLVREGCLRGSEQDGFPARCLLTQTEDWGLHSLSSLNLNPNSPKGRVLSLHVEDQLWSDYPFRTQRALWVPMSLKSLGGMWGGTTHKAMPHHCGP